VAYHCEPLGKVALVLGAGNYSSIGPVYTFFKLSVENQVVVYEPNPVKTYLGLLIEESFKRLLTTGFCPSLTAARLKTPIYANTLASMRFTLLDQKGHLSECLSRRTSSVSD
jgi:hypothetical protein